MEIKDILKSTWRLWESLEVIGNMVWRMVVGLGMLAILKTIWGLDEGWFIPAAIIIFSISPLVRELRWYKRR